MADLETLIEAMLKHARDSGTFTNAVTSLASLSREEETARTRLATKDVLQRLMQVVCTKPIAELDKDFLAATLRCIGNACVSNPEACQTVTGHKFDWSESLILGYASSASGYRTEDSGSPGPQPIPEIRDLTIKVLYNICSQSEEAQKQCYHDAVHESMFHVLKPQHETNYLAPEILSLAIDLLFWITSHHKDLSSFEGETRRKRGLAGNRAVEPRAMFSLMKAPPGLVNQLDVEDWATLVEVVLVFAREPVGQNQIVDDHHFSRLWHILENNESKVRTVEEDNAEDLKLLTALSTSLTWALSDASANPAFAALYADPTKGSQVTDKDEGEEISLLHQQIEDLLQLLSTGTVHSLTATRHNTEIIDNDSLRLTTAACQVVGNLLHNLKATDSDFPLAIQDRHVHKHLLELMATSDNADFLHSAAGFLIQLSRPSSQTREEIGLDSHALPALRRLGQHTMQELNQDALMLMRALGKDTPAVQERLKQLAGEVMASVAETQQAAANAGAAQPLLSNTS